MLKVAQIMSRQVFTVSEDDNLDEALFLFNTELVSGLPVRDREGTIVGILSKSDIVSAESESKPLSMRKVSDAMQNAIWAVGADTPVRDAVALMADKSIHRVLVVENTKVVGIMTAMDVVRAVAEGRIG